METPDILAADYFTANSVFWFHLLATDPTQSLRPAGDNLNLNSQLSPVSLPPCGLWGREKTGGQTSFCVGPVWLCRVSAVPLGEVRLFLHESLFLQVMKEKKFC